MTDVALHVETVGDGPVALVLHGGLGVDHHLYRSLDLLADDLRLVLYDHRGNGRSGGDATTATMQQWAADAAALATEVGGDDPVIVIGHSYGGFIAQELAIAHPEVVRALVLIATTPGQLGTGEQPAPDGAPMPDEFAELLAAMPDTDDDLAAFMDRLAPAYVHRAGADQMRAAMAGTVFRVAAMRRGFDELARWSSVDRLGSIEVPVLLVFGRHDGFTGWPQSGRIASRIPHAEEVLLEHSGHLPWLDEPDEFVAAIRSWLDRHGLR